MTKCVKTPTMFIYSSPVSLGITSKLDNSLRQKDWPDLHWLVISSLWLKLSQFGNNNLAQTNISFINFSRRRQRHKTEISALGKKIWNIYQGRHNRPNAGGYSVRYIVFKVCILFGGKVRAWQEKDPPGDHEYSQDFLQIGTVTAEIYLSEPGEKRTSTELQSPGSDSDQYDEFQSTANKTQQEKSWI